MDNPESFCSTSTDTQDSGFACGMRYLVEHETSNLVRLFAFFSRQIKQNMYHKQKNI